MKGGGISLLRCWPLSACVRLLANVMNWFAFIEINTSNTRKPRTCDNNKDEEGPCDDPFWLHAGRVKS